MISTLIAIIIALGSLVLWLFGKKSTTEAILKNQEVQSELNKIDGNIVKNQALIDAEKEANEERKKNETNQDILNGINKK